MARWWQAYLNLAVIGNSFKILGECKIHSVADFWNESLTIFEEQVESDLDAKEAMSARTYPNGIIVDEPRVLGRTERVAYYGEDDEMYTKLESAQSAVRPLRISRLRRT